MVEDFAVVGALADFATAHAMGADRVTVFDPVGDVHIMNVLLDDVIAAKPNEVVPVAHLVFHFGGGAPELFLDVLAGFEPRSGAVPIDAHRGDVANRAVMQSLNGFEVRRLVT